MHRLFVEPGQYPLNGKKLMRGDDYLIGVVIVDSRFNVTPAPTVQLKFGCKRKSEFPLGEYVIQKIPSDFTQTMEGNTLRAKFKITSEETQIVNDRELLVYDLEQTIVTATGELTTTLERGDLTIDLDVVTY